MPARRIASTHRGLHIHHVDPLAKGLACLCCRQRKVRCDGVQPACSTCVRSAKHEGRDVSLVRCEYAPQRRKRRAAPRSNESGTESEDHSDSDVQSETESESSVTSGPRFLSDLTEEPAGIARDLENLAKLLNLQLQESQPFTTVTPVPQNSYDSGYSSDSSFASYDAFSHYEDSSFTTITESPAQTNSFFSFDTSSLTFSDAFAPASKANAISEPLPLANQYPFVDPLSVFAYPTAHPIHHEISLASLPASGDYFTQSPTDVAKSQQVTSVVAPSLVLESQPMRPEWNSWLTL